MTAQIGTSPHAKGIRSVPTLRTRFLQALGANATGQVVTVALQVASLPLFLSQWSTETYGIWLMLSAVAGHLTVADGGMVAVAGNRMTMAMARQDGHEALVVLRSACALVGSVGSVVFALAAALLAFLPLESILTTDGRLALLFLVLGVLTAIVGGLNDAIFRSTDRFAQGTMLGHGTRLAEWLGGLIGLFSVGSLAAVAMGSLIARLLATALVYRLAVAGDHGLTIGVREASRLEMRAMVSPSAAYVAIPISSALGLQGTTLVVGAFFGPAVVTLFTAYRTLARIVTQAVTIVSNSLWPEFSRLYGANNRAALTLLYARSALWSLLGVCLLVAGLAVAGEFVLKLWTHGSISFDRILFLLLVGAAALAGVASLPRTLLVATNQHTLLSLWLAGCAVATFLLALLFGKLLGPSGVALATLVGEAAGYLASLFLAKSMLRRL